MGQEHKRKLVHIGMVVFALAIGRLSPLLIVAATVAAFCFNLLVLPRLSGRGLEREHELARGYSLGMLIYPAVLCLLALLFFDQQVYVAVAWGAMAFGDGFAGLVGRALGGPKLPWQPQKGLIGSLAFVLLGGPLTLGLVCLLPEPSRLGLDLGSWALAIAVGVIVAALVETVPGTVDDNLVVPIAAAAAAYLVNQLHGLPDLPLDWPTGLAVVLALVVLSIGSRKIDLPGGLCGGLLAWLIFLGCGLAGLLALGLFFVLGSLASHYRKRDKEALGAAQEHGGKRSVRHALANGGVAGLCGLLAWLFPGQQALWTVALFASLASATADTLASELGTLMGKRFVNILSFKPDRRGLDGVVSLEGTLVGALGALIMAAAFALSHPGFAWRSWGLIALAGFWGNYIDSVLGATLQRRGLMSNDTVNFANTAVAALLALLALGWVPLA